MKVRSTILILGAILEGIFARNLPLAKRDDEECKFVNSLLNKDASYDCCTNSKITCENNYITKIALTKFDIRNATLPSSVGTTMPMLKTVLLNECDLVGSIPVDIGNLMNLEDFELSTNKLTGPIPESIGKLSKLITLILNGNQLSGPIPSTIGGLSSINLIWLYENQLTSIPQEIGSLTTLTQLNLSYNKFTGSIPDTISQMTNLMNLDLSNNLDLKGKAPNTKGLQRLNIGCNLKSTSVCFTEEDKDSRCKYPNNDYICSNCKENASLADDNICQCNSGYLGTGYIECYNDCKFVNGLLGKDETEECCGFDETKIKCSSHNRVTEIVLEKADIKNPKLPSTIGSLPYLEKLSLSKCDVEGSIPSDIGQLAELKELILDNNKLTGTIPDISGLTNLQTLALNNNELNGNISQDIEKLAMTLVNLSLNNNKLSGTIPAEIGKLTRLQTLNLSNNELEGDIPVNIIDLYSNLQELLLNNNKLFGTIPTDIGSLYKLKSLDLSNNDLVGTIPTSISSLSNYFKQLNLGNNKLNGDISNIGNLNNLEYLNLSANQFNGTIPTSFGNLYQLKSLDLSNNQFSDLIPTKELEKLNALTEINLSDNKELYGQVINTKNLAELTQCNFSGTNLCNPKDKSDTRCTYSEGNYDCTVCKENAAVDTNNMCQCNENYTGIGYISCTRIPGTEEEQKTGTVSDNDLNNNSGFEGFTPRNLKYIFKFVNVVITVIVMGKLFM